MNNIYRSIGNAWGEALFCYGSYLSNYEFAIQTTAWSANWELRWSSEVTSMQPCTTDNLAQCKEFHFLSAMSVWLHVCQTKKAGVVSTRSDLFCRRDLVEAWICTYVAVYWAIRTWLTHEMAIVMRLQELKNIIKQYLYFRTSNIQVCTSNGISVKKIFD